MNAIPTRYAGVNFRSRLEARWAAFFDLWGISWIYEPIDLAGYIPDFLVYVRRQPHQPREWMLVEVKPLLDGDSPDDVAQKIDRSGWRRDALILGADICFGYERIEPGDWVDLGVFALLWAEDEFEIGDPSSNRDALREARWREAGNRVQWKRNEQYTEL